MNNQNYIHYKKTVAISTLLNDHSFFSHFQILCTSNATVAIRFASCLQGFPCGKPARIIFQPLYTLDANHPIGFGQPRSDTRPSATLQGCSSGRRLLRGCFPRGT